MDYLHKYVLKNGTLNGLEIYSSQNIYKGMNGRYVERFHVTPSESYVFKPLTNDEQRGKESWVYEHVLPLLPTIYPKMLAKSSALEEAYGWVIFEDLGTLTHVFTEELALRVASLLALWHAIPTDIVINAELQGPKPPIEKIAEEILSKKEMLLKVADELTIPENVINLIFKSLDSHTFSTEKVLSHGDLHLGNYTVVDERVVILDWEHLHLNSRHWDLYHLLDISHPVFPKSMTNKLRNQILDLYIKETLASGRLIETNEFKREYYLFSTTFSLWMLLLIQGDLSKKETKWPMEQLKNQLNETMDSFIQCAEELEGLS